VSGLRRTYILVLAWLVIIFLVYLYGQSDYALLYVASNMIAPASAALPALFSIMLVRRYASGPKHGLSGIWLYLTTGLFLWLMGEITWSVYALALSVPIPYPSIADLFWIVGYAPIVLFLLGYTMPFRQALSSRTIWGTIGITLLTTLVVLVILVGPIVTLGEEPMIQFFDLAYPTLDLVLLGLSIAGMVIFLPGKLSRFWAWLNLGFILIVVADLAFSYSTAVGLYYDGHPLELLYYLGDSAILLGLCDHSQILQEK